MELNFHHIGVACKSIEQELKHWYCLGYQLEGERFFDDNQGVSGVFLIGNGPRIELLEPLNNAATIHSFLQSGVKMYHQAYEVKGLAQAIEKMKKSRAKLISPPKPAIAFSGRNVAFMMQPNLMIIELIEQGG